MKYKVSGYYDGDFRGLAESQETDNFDEVINLVHAYCCNGEFVRAENLNTGACEKYIPDNWLAEIELGGVDKSIYEILDKTPASVKGRAVHTVDREKAVEFMKKVPYAVSQSNHGHEYVWIFDEKTLREKLANESNLESLNVFDKEMEKEGSFFEDISWPIGGSNSSSTSITKLETFEDAIIFICYTCEGPDLEDPMLVDIAEYIRTVSLDEDSITQEFMDAFMMNDSFKFDSYDERYDELLSLGYTNEDMYGDMREVRYSEVAGIKKGSIKLHAKVVKEIVVEPAEAEKLVNYLCGCVENAEISNIRRAFTNGINAGDDEYDYGKGYIPVDWLYSDLEYLDENSEPKQYLDENSCVFEDINLKEDR